MLVSAVMPIMSIYRLPHGQYGYSGHVINLPQDVCSFSRSLPRLPSELDVIIVRKEGTHQSHRDFRVRTSVVYQALQWLIMHNKYYRALNVCIDDKALGQLPEDGNLSQLRVIAVDSPATDGLPIATSTTTTCTSSSAPTTSTSPEDTIPTTCTCNSAISYSHTINDRARSSCEVC